MFAKDFSYAAPASLAEALALLQSQPEGEVKLVAGGQSLIPLLKLRMTEIGALVDVSKIPELHGITDDGDGVLIGAATTYFQAVNSPLVQRRCPLVIQAVSQVGDPQVRARGTIGGSLAHADPAGDLPAVALAVDAELRATGPGGSRSIPATAFFVDLMTTALQPAEVLTAVRFHATDALHAGTAYVKHRHPASGYAIVGVAAAVWLNDDGTCRAAHVGITGAGTHATRAVGVEQALAGKRLDDATLTAACANAADSLDLMSDPYASGEYRAHLTRVLAKRVLAEAAATAAQR